MTPIYHPDTSSNSFIEFSCFDNITKKMNHIQEVSDSDKESEQIIDILEYEGSPNVKDKTSSGFFRFPIPVSEQSRFLVGLIFYTYVLS